MGYNDCSNCIPIHYICRYSTTEMIKYIIDRNVELEDKIQSGLKPLDLVSRYSNKIMYNYTNNQTNNQTNNNFCIIS